MPMKFRTLIIILSILVLHGCTTTSYFAEEYGKTYILTEAVEVRPCETFTGGWSVWFGPEKVECLGGWPGEPTLIFQKGSLVKIEKLYEIGAVDAFYNKCRARISDSKGNSRVVYSDWPSLSKKLVLSNESI
jgi:hypothetical protein